MQHIFSKILMFAFVNLLTQLCLADMDWVPVTTEFEMLRKEDHSMVFDNDRGFSFLYGGMSYPNQRANPMFCFDGTDWFQIDPEPNWPQMFRSDFAMAYDPNREVVVIFGGFQGDFDYLGDTWEWDGETWEEKYPEHRPSDRAGQVMVYADMLDQCVLFGGYEEGGVIKNDTWFWDGDDWELMLTQSAPSPRLSKLVYDDHRERIVLFGGTEDGWQGLNDTWVFDGEDWIELSPTISPPKVCFHAISYDSLRDRCVVFGGAPLSGGFLDETWEFDGTTWEKITTQHHPLGRGAHAMCYDSIRHRTVLFGGYSWDGPERDTWEYYDVPTPTITTTPTITPIPTMTPVFTETPSATSTPTATPTATAIPELGVSLSLSGTTFHTNDPFILTAIISNPGPESLMQQPFALVLDIQGNYFWYPDWTGTFTVEPLDLPVGTVEKEIFNFLWPDVDGSFTGAMFYGALLSTEQTSILGNWGYAEFGW